MVVKGDFMFITDNDDGTRTLNLEEHSFNLCLKLQESNIESLREYLTDILEVVLGENSRLTSSSWLFEDFGVRVIHYNSNVTRLRFFHISNTMYVDMTLDVSELKEILSLLE